MDINESIDKLENAISNFDDWMNEILEEMATSALSLVINRIQQEGLPGKKYSTNKLPEYFFEGRGLNAGGRQLISKRKKAKKEDRGISYIEWREANGLQTAIVDLTFSGRMFQGLEVGDVSQSGEQYIITVTATDKETTMKLKENAKRYGNFLVLTKQEEEELANSMKEALFKKVKQALS